MFDDVINAISSKKIASEDTYVLVTNRMWENKVRLVKAQAELASWRAHEYYKNTITHGTNPSKVDYLECRQRINKLTEAIISDQEELLEMEAEFYDFSNND